MNKVILYIKDSSNVYQAVDLFEDETISVTSKIQDIRDISKVFTDFSQSFTIPASKKNNKIFRHFYNYFITDGAFDARKKVDAILEINYIPFREGKVFLNGVKMKDNKAESYRLTFFGNTVNLPDILGDDELESLTWLDNFEYEYTSPNTKTRLTGNLNQTVNSVVKYDPIVVPLLTHTKRLYMDTRNPEGHNNDTLAGNLYYYHNNSHSEDAALRFEDLKPALRLIYVIEAIEEKYPDIRFTRDFFDSEVFIGDGTTTNRGLYMWLSREKGRIGGEGGQSIETTLKNFSYSSGDQLSTFEGTFNFSDSGADTDSLLTTNSFSFGLKPRVYRYTTLDLSTINTTSGVYSIKIIDTLDNNAILLNEENLTGDQTVTLEMGRQVTSVLYGLKFLVTSEGGFQSEFSLRIRQITESGYSISTTRDGTFVPDSITATASGLVKPTERMPKMKILDFITSIFKTFNLTAYYVQDRGDADYGKIRVLPLDEYYSDSPSIFDITKYVDSSEFDVKSTIPFSEIEFKNKEPKTLLMLQHKEAFNEVFGDAIYKPQNVDRGKPYKVESKFEHFKFERIKDVNPSSSFTNGVTNFQWGYSAGDNFKPDASSTPKTGNYDSVLMSPAIFYCIKITGLSGDGRLNWNGTSHQPLGSYWKPSNTVESGSTSTPPDFTINFDDEEDEWNLTNYGGTTNSLFSKFYQTYIEDVFDPRKRIFKLTAHLPNSILLNYRLNDRFQIGDKVFTINSIDTNLKTGESKLELLNVL